jgi:gluconate:H+ symporter, GntP family
VDTTTERAASDDVTRPPSFAVTLATILFPVVLMLLKAAADIIWSAMETLISLVAFGFISILWGIV